ncbi:MAG: hypothetical protein QM765_22035 [Myxococcales bacterium]
MPRRCGPGCSRTALPSPPCSTREKLARAWGVNAFPTSFFVGKDGEIRFVETGYTTELGMRLRLALAGR